jgi:hypothetical protein
MCDMIRIPRSHNSKCVLRHNNVADSSTEVKIVQSWNGMTPQFNPLLYDFHICLFDTEPKRTKERTIQQRRTARDCKIAGSSNIHHNILP